MKQYLFLLVVLSAIGLSACAADTETSEAPTSQSTDTERTFTTEELAQFTGQDGQPAYVAVNGVVYDVSNSPRWPNGNHNGYQAGQDLTSAFAAQHGDNRMGSFPVVGRYVG